MPPPTGNSSVTRLLWDARAGDQEALGRLLPLVYDELRTIARRQLRRERRDHTVQPTALVHEAYVRLIDQRAVRWQDRSHFFAIAAQAMRRILIDYARARRSAKRGRGAVHERLDASAELAVADFLDPDRLIALDEAMAELAGLDPQQARIVELRFFADLSVEETALVLGISSGTVKRDWSLAKAWLQRRFSGAR